MTARSADALRGHRNLAAPLTRHPKRPGCRLRAAAGLALLGLLLAAAPAGPAAATTLCLTDKLKYTNKGAYEVNHVNVVWLDDDGKKHEKHFAPQGYDENSVLNTSESWTIDLWQNAAAWGIAEGDEVWLKISILWGEDKSCRKDEYKLIYNRTSGREMKFHTAGTTLNNNRCKYSGDISKDCYTGE